MDKNTHFDLSFDRLIVARARLSFSASAACINAVLAAALASLAFVCRASSCAFSSCASSSCAFLMQATLLSSSLSQAASANRRCRRQVSTMRGCIKHDLLDHIGRVSIHIRSRIIHCLRDAAGEEISFRL